MQRICTAISLDDVSGGDLLEEHPHATLWGWIWGMLHMLYAARPKDIGAMN